MRFRIIMTVIMLLYIAMAGFSAYTNWKNEFEFVPKFEPHVKLDLFDQHSTFRGGIVFGNYIGFPLFAWSHILLLFKQSPAETDREFGASVRRRFYRKPRWSGAAMIPAVALVIMGFSLWLAFKSEYVIPQAMDSVSKLREFDLHLPYYRGVCLSLNIVLALMFLGQLFRVLWPEPLTEILAGGPDRPKAVPVIAALDDRGAL